MATRKCIGMKHRFEFLFRSFPMYGLGQHSMTNKAQQN